VLRNDSDMPVLNGSNEKVAKTGGRIELKGQEKNKV
jgi:hypothetical protein